MFGGQSTGEIYSVMAGSSSMRVNCLTLGGRAVETGCDRAEPGG